MVRFGIAMAVGMLLVVLCRWHGLPAIIVAVVAGEPVVGAAVVAGGLVVQVD